MKTTTDTTLDNFTQAYLVCALWSENDDSDTPLENNYHIEQLASVAMDTAKQDCALFQKQNEELLSQMYAAGHKPEQAGHDLWLTRNGHGAGFWDRGMGDLGNKLADAARDFKTTDLYVGDDGQLYLSMPAVDGNPTVKAPKL